MSTMPNITNNKLLWEQVIKEAQEDMKGAVEMIVKYSEHAIAESLTDRENIRLAMAKAEQKQAEELGNLRKVIQGNGDPSHSVITRLERIEEAQTKLHDALNKILWAIASTVTVQIVMYLLKVL